MGPGGQRCEHRWRRFRITSQTRQPRLVSSGGQLYLGWIDDHVTAVVPTDPTSPPRLSAVYVKRWNGSAFAEDLPGDAAYQGISSTGGVVQNLALAVDQAGHPFAAWQDARNGTPEVYVRGNAFTVGTVYYVNDGATTGDVFTTATGAAGNTGLSVQQPEGLAAASPGRLRPEPGRRDPDRRGDLQRDGDDRRRRRRRDDRRDAGVGDQVLRAGDGHVSGVVFRRLDLSGGAAVNSAADFTASGEPLRRRRADDQRRQRRPVAHNLFQATAANLTLTGGASQATIEHNRLTAGATGIAVTGTGATQSHPRQRDSGQRDRDLAGGRPAAKSQGAVSEPGGAACGVRGRVRFSPSASSS